jgi:redox-sensitive bicupin YhaK (pirin superfamily)
MSEDQETHSSIILRKASERGLTEIGWLHSRHSFSFGEYYDPRYMGFRSLRVINDDWVKAGAGFGMHGHRDMEIVTIVVEGALEHKDSLGHGSVLQPNEVQVMTAGRGIRHSEFNPSKTAAAHFIQIWIEPEKSGLEPAYAQRAFDPTSRLNTLLRVAGKKMPDDQALAIHQDAHLYVTRITANATLDYSVKEGRGAWVHTISGQCTVNGHTLSGGDAVALKNGGTLKLTGIEDATEIILFDLA